jgi:hypothetical protein
VKALESRLKRVLIGAWLRTRGCTKKRRRLKMRYNPFTAKGNLEVKDTPFKGLKRFITEPKRVGTKPIVIESKS